MAACKMSSMTLDWLKMRVLWPFATSSASSPMMNSVLQDVPTPAALSLLVAIAEYMGNAPVELVSDTQTHNALAGLNCTSDD